MVKIKTYIMTLLILFIITILIFELTLAFCQILSGIFQMFGFLIIYFHIKN